MPWKAWTGGISKDSAGYSKAWKSFVKGKMFSKQTMVAY